MGRQTPDRVINPPAKREQIYRRRMKAAEMRRKGHQWQEIADEVGFASRGAACAAVKELLREHQSLAYEEIALYRQESLDRLTDLLKVAMTKAIGGDEKMMREARLIISQMDDLTGAKAPIKVEIGESDVDRLLREAEAELGRRSAANTVQASRVQADPGADQPG